MLAPPIRKYVLHIFQNNIYSSENLIFFPYTSKQYVFMRKTFFFSIYISKQYILIRKASSFIFPYISKQCIYIYGYMRIPPPWFFEHFVFWAFLEFIWIPIEFWQFLHELLKSIWIYTNLAHVILSHCPTELGGIFY